MNSINYISYLKNTLNINSNKSVTVKNKKIHKAMRVKIG